MSTKWISVADLSDMCLILYLQQRTVTFHLPVGYLKGMTVSCNNEITWTNLP